MNPRDRYKSAQNLSPFAAATAITPHDGTDLVDVPTSAVYVGGAGALKVTMASGDTVTFTALPIGFHNLQVTRIWATGTAATNIMALY